MSDLMETQAGDPGAFTRFDLSRVPSPSFVVDEKAIEANLQILADVAEQSGATILSALKAFSFPAVAPLIGKYLSGVCTSGVYEARLAGQFYQGEIVTYCAGYKMADMPDVIALSDHIIFNSPEQKKRFMPTVLEADKKVSIGLRINPEHSEGQVAKYDPCAPFSRLGMPVAALTAEDMEGVEGVHMHTLCEQGFEPLQRTWEAVKPKLTPYLSQLKWINFGGGHLITRADYNREGLIAFVKKLRAETGLEVYLEPGEAIALDAGILVGEILDLGHNGMNLAITDISATCHMPDVMEAPYRPEMLGETDAGESYRFGGPSCLTGDVIGDYNLVDPKIGDRIAFMDQAHYSMVKTNSFNGVPLPSIMLWNSETDDLKTIREFTYDDFVTRFTS